MQKILTMILAEVERAENLHPHWPDDIIHAVGIVVEESGEAMRAALNYTYEQGVIDDIRVELIQTAATAIRALESLDGVE